jgi:hypothetical protein
VLSHFLIAIVLDHFLSCYSVMRGRESAWSGQAHVREVAHGSVASARRTEPRGAAQDRAVRERRRGSISLVDRWV